MIKSWFEALNYIVKEPERAHKLMAIPLGISAKELEEQMKTLKLMDLASNKIYLGTPTKPGQLNYLLEKIANVWLKNKVIKTKSNISEIINNSYLE